MKSPPGSQRQDASAEEGSHVLRFGTAVGLGFAAALVGTAPAALRLTSTTSALLPAWSVLVAATLVPCIALVALFRGTRVGARGFMGGAALEHGASLFFFSSVLPLWLAAFGSLLRAKTHHHALAGVTYGIVTLVLVVLVAAVSARLSRIAASRGELASRVTFFVAFAAFLGSVAILGLRASRAGEPAWTTFLDTTALLLASGFASRKSFAELRPLALVGPPAAAAALALGVVTARGETELRAQVHAHAAVYAPFVDGLARR